MKRQAATITAAFAALCGAALYTTDSLARDATPDPELVVTSDIEWGPLNPARGNKGPKAGTLWGDRTAEGPSGFLVEFADGFASPPHIHNVTYRGVVIRGLVHNDDPNAAEMWMPPGSFWTQPVGEEHITAGKGGKSLAYIEIEKGPYLVRPSEEAYDSGERPVNVDPSNIVWLDASNLRAIEASAPSDGPELAYLWGNPQDNQRNGTLVKLPAGFSGTLRSQGTSFRAVVIEGQPRFHTPDKSTATSLEPGNYFGGEGKREFTLSTEANNATILYVRAEGNYDILATPTAE